MGEGRETDIIWISTFVVKELTNHLPLYPPPYELFITRNYLKCNWSICRVSSCWVRIKIQLSRSIICVDNIFIIDYKKHKKSFLLLYILIERTLLLFHLRFHNFIASKLSRYSVPVLFVKWLFESKIKWTSCERNGTLMFAVIRLSELSWLLICLTRRKSVGDLYLWRHINSKPDFNRFIIFNAVFLSYLWIN